MMISNISPINQARYDLAAEITRDLQDTKNISVMARFCSYCGAYMGLKDGNGNTGPSHGICPDCKQEQLAYSQASAGRGLV